MIPSPGLRLGSPRMARGGVRIERHVRGNDRPMIGVNDRAPATPLPYSQGTEARLL